MFPSNVSLFYFFISFTLSSYGKLISSSPETENNLHNTIFWSAAGFYRPSTVCEANAALSESGFFSPLSLWLIPVVSGQREGRHRAGPRDSDGLARPLPERASQLLSSQTITGDVYSVGRRVNLLSLFQSVTTPPLSRVVEHGTLEGRGRLYSARREQTHRYAQVQILTTSRCRCGHMVPPCRFK